MVFTGKPVPMKRASHRSRKPGTALSVLFNDKQLEPKATLSAQGIQDVPQRKGSSHRDGCGCGGQNRFGINHFGW